MKTFAFIEDALSSEVDECILWPWKCHGDGYPKVKRGNKYYRVNRLIAAEKHGPCPIDKECAHECGNKLCINPCHVYWKTHAENCLDRIKHGTTTGILTENQVYWIRSQIQAARGD